MDLQVIIIAIESALLVVETTVIILAFRQIYKERKNRISFKETEQNAFFTDEILIINAKLLKNLDEKLAFEFERNLRRIFLFTNNESLQHQSLMWFFHNSIVEDYIFIHNAIRNNCFKNENLKALADKVLNKIKDFRI
jgi:hypothetical protein